MQKLSIGIDISFETFLDTRALFQATSGGGKSYAVRKTIESIGKKVQQLVIDPEGEFSTLREKFDFALVARSGGDIPLTIKYAEALAHRLFETNISAIIDLYELSPVDRVLFVKVFLTELINIDKKLWHPCVVYLDEADKFAPEKGKAESSRPVEDLVAMGRKRGICAVLATQRIAKLSKDVTAELLNKFIGRTSQDVDRKRAAEELGFTTREQNLALRNLAPGEFYTFGPAISDDVQKFKVKTVLTTHPKAGKRVVSVPPTPQAIKSILKKLADIPQEAEKELETKAQMMREIKRLNGELSKATKAVKVSPAGIDKTPALLKEITNLKEEVKRLNNSASKWMADSVKAKTVLIKIKELAANEIGTHAKAIPVPYPKDLAKQPANVIPAPTKAPIPAPANNPSVTSFGTTKLPQGEELILKACYQFPNGLEREQLTVIVGYKKSTRDAYILRLKEKGLITQDGSRIVATPAGEAVLGDGFEKLPTGEALQEYWLKNLPQGEALILEVLLKAYPNSVDRDKISEETGYQKSTRDAYIQRMSAKEIVVAQGKGKIKASEFLFE